MHNGKIWLESKENIGTTFILPFQNRNLLYKYFLMKKLNSILLIDDDNASNFLHRLIIQSIDCADHIKICTSAQKGLDYLKQNSDEEFIQPDLIFWISICLV